MNPEEVPSILSDEEIARLLKSEASGRRRSVVLLAREGSQPGRIEAHLNGQGYIVERTGDPYRALDLARSPGCVAILSDLEAWDMGSPDLGHRVAESSREQGRALLFICDKDPDAVESAHSLGATAVLTRPVNLEDLDRLLGGPAETTERAADMGAEARFYRSLYQIAREMGRPARSGTDLVVRVGDLAMSLTDADACGVILIGAPPGEVQSRAVSRHAHMRETTARVLVKANQYLLEGTGSLEGFDPGTQGFRTIEAIDLGTGGEVRGAVFLLYKDPRRITQETRSVLRHLAEGLRDGVCRLEEGAPATHSPGVIPASTLPQILSACRDRWDRTGERFALLAIEEVGAGGCPDIHRVRRELRGGDLVAAPAAGGPLYVVLCGIQEGEVRTIAERIRESFLADGKGIAVGARIVLVPGEAPSETIDHVTRAARLLSQVVGGGVMVEGGKG